MASICSGPAASKSASSSSAATARARLCQHPAVIVRICSCGVGSGAEVFLVMILFQLILTGVEAELGFIELCPCLRNTRLLPLFPHQPRQLAGRVVAEERLPELSWFGSDSVRP